MKILCGRAQMIGDSVAAIPVASYLKRKYPNSQTIWPLAKKTSQMAPLLLNHPDIDTVYICDGLEGPESTRDWELVNSCDLKINPNPSHPDGRYPSEFNIYSESWRMAGMPIHEWENLTEEQKRPRLYKWWTKPRLQSVASIKIAYWPQAGYGVENKRNASLKWRNDFSSILYAHRFHVHQFGSPKDDKLECTVDHREKSFLEQVQLSLECDLMIGTDSGSALITAAYQEQVQISLLTNHWPGIERNNFALAPNSPKNFNFFGLDSADNIRIVDVLDKVKELTIN